MAEINDICTICYEKFDKNSKKRVECNYCNSSVCRVCFQTYILNTMDLICSNVDCKKPFSLDFVQSNVSKTFFNSEYRKKRENMIYEIEKSYLPATQLIIEQDNEIEKIDEILNEKYKSMKELRIDIDRLYITKFNIRNRENDIKTEKREFIKHCPNTDCKGFLSQQWMCGLCNTKVCKNCQEIKQDENNHTCDEKILATVLKMKSDVKNCPKCTANIYKIDGCDQMFCTCCHTAFSWKTLNIETNRIHNPHYYEWMRSQNNGIIPREPGDNPCNDNNDIRLVGERHFMAKIDPVLKNSEYENKIWNIYMLVFHMSEYLSSRYRESRSINFNTHIEIRKYFMKNVITETEYKAKLFIQQKHINKKNEFNQIISLFLNVVKEKINNTYKQNTIISSLQFEILFKELDKIRIFTNNNCRLISDRYNKCKYPNVDEDWKTIIL